MSAPVVRAPAPPSLRALRWHGVGASVLITVASWGIGWFPRNQHSPLARTGFFIQFRTELIGVLACMLIMAVGLVWLTRCWLLLRPRVENQGQLPGRTLAGLVASWGAPLLASFPILSRDVYSYLAQGRMLQAGKSPYSEGISALPGWFDGGSDGLWAQSPSPYGVLFLVVARLIYVISGGIPEIGVGLLRLLAVAGVAGCYWATGWLARRLGVNPHWALWVIVANPLFLLTMIGGVHNDALMIAATFWAFGLAQGRRIIASTFALAVAVSIKPIVLVLLPFLGLMMLGRSAGLRERIAVWWRTTLAIAGWLTLFGALTGLWFGWLPAMLTSGAAAFPYAPVGLLGTLFGLLASLFGADASVVAQVVFTLARLFSVYLVARLALARNISDPLRLGAWALSAVVLLAPIIQPWYILWLFALFFISQQVSWTSEKLMIGLSMLITLAVFVDQISIEQWHPVWLLRILAALLGVGLLASMLRWDRQVRQVGQQLGACRIPRS